MANRLKKIKLELTRLRRVQNPSVRDAKRAKRIVKLKAAYRREVGS
ncbi:MAG: hypothetical protein Kow0069_01690 [Promethearchaeota archaeon]